MSLTPESVTSRVFEIADIKSNDMRIFQCSQDASAFMNSRKKENADVHDRRFVTAAAVYAYCKYLLMSGMANCDIDTFKAGDLNINFKSDCGIVPIESVIKSALAEISDMLIDTEFIFTAV